ncbi:gamma-glutamyltranspeptidase/glutathione hydrolase [Pseudoxanthomonas winnipegensis]|uniref:Glutathione hydrolase proenzyme n=1 Tax=Pseudoxanthomonas winnipegensis TaxID=2480810 RepID=A0AAW8G9N9_9GAMM|nr:gamma-glutamyltranspeptidase/glutathione hydrolase [Pseudoxanthomonas winnipegensis]
MKRSSLFAVALTVLLPVAASAQQATHPPGAAIASGHKLATEAGLEIIREGGNAFDAAVAVSSTLGVVEPISSGLGGGGFFLLHDAATGQDTMIDARETAPESASPDKYLDKDGKLDQSKSINGPWSAGIPGLPAALVELAEKHGKLPLKQSLAPAIRIATEGFPVYDRMARGYAQRAKEMEKYPGTREVYLRGGKPIQTGEIFKQPELAHTLTLLAEKGRDGFYKGETAKKLLAGVKAAGGQWTAQELAGYQVKTRAPIQFDYKGWKITTVPPPSSGGIALAEMLQIVEGYDLKAMDPAHRAHLVVEAMRRAYRDRTFFLGDPDFTTIPQKVLLSKDYALGLRSTINPDKATPSDLLSGNPTPLEDDETTHFSIIDAQGNRVGATQTVNLLYGSGLIPKGTGVLLNDEMDDFALKPGTPNAFGVMGYEGQRAQAGQAPLKLDDAHLHGERRQDHRARHAGRQPHHHHGAAGHPGLRRWAERAAGRRAAALPPPVVAGRHRRRDRHLLAGDDQGAGGDGPQGRTARRRGCRRSRLQPRLGQPADGGMGSQDQHPQRRQRPAQSGRRRGDPDHDDALKIANVVR